MPKEQPYLLPLEAIVAAMQESPTMVSVQAQLPPLPTLAKEFCIAELILGQGRIHACTITTRMGHPLHQHQEAYLLLQRLPLGDLAWSVRSITTPHDGLATQERPLPRQMSPPMSGKMVRLPMRIVTSLSPAQMRTMASTHKHVFALVDGTKTVEHIAWLLTKSIPEIQQILHDLQEMNLIKL